jgi:Predicted transcriptional regulator containing an HTH domain and an uncharacterized domain shared with the mammalian protein Schlafen
MTNAQLEEFFAKRNFSYSDWERTPTPYGMDDVDEDLLIRYVNQGYDCGRVNFLYRDVKTTLSKLELLSGDRLNNARLYLFSNKKPLLLKLAVFPTDGRTVFSDMRQFRGNIFECIEEAVKYVMNNIRWRADTVSAHEIYITPSRVHIYNPGPFVPGTDPKLSASGEQGSLIRNPLIATALYYNKTIDAFGTGFERVFRLCGEEKVQYHNTDFGFTFGFMRETVPMMAPRPGYYMRETAAYGAEADDRLILELLRLHGGWTKEMLAQQTGKSAATISRIIKRLKESGRLERRGSNKKGYWVVKE